MIDDNKLIIEILCDQLRSEQEAHIATIRDTYSRISWYIDKVKMLENELAEERKKNAK